MKNCVYPRLFHRYSFQEDEAFSLLGLGSSLPPLHCPSESEWLPLDFAPGCSLLGQPRGSSSRSPRSSIPPMEGGGGGEEVHGSGLRVQGVHVSKVSVIIIITNMARFFLSYYKATTMKTLWKRNEDDSKFKDLPLRFKTTLKNMRPRCRKAEQFGEVGGQ